MKKQLLKIGMPFIKCYWRVFRPQTLGVRAILLKNNSVVLVKHVYSNAWFLPGGGMKKKETFNEAIERELREELAIQFSHSKLHGIYTNFKEGKKDSVFVFIIENFSISDSKDAEIEDFGFFPLSELPIETSPGTKRRLEELMEGNAPYCTFW